MSFWVRSVWWWRESNNLGLPFKATRLVRIHTVSRVDSKNRYLLNIHDDGNERENLTSICFKREISRIWTTGQLDPRSCEPGTWVFPGLPEVFTMILKRPSLFKSKSLSSCQDASKIKGSHLQTGKKIDEFPCHSRCKETFSSLAAITFKILHPHSRHG